MKKIFKRETVKTGVQMVANFCVGTVIGNIVKSVTPAPTNIISKIVTGIGSSCLCDVASEAVSEYVGNRFDETVDEIKKIKEFKKETK